jgi:serine/threonine protein kinase
MNSIDDNTTPDVNIQGSMTNPTLHSLAAVEKPVSPDIALKLILQVANALTDASQSGFVHQNLRPETILVQEDGFSVVLNFDAPVPQPGAEDWDMRYSSPEQKEGKVLDSRSNIYTLGIILYELINGFPPEAAFEPNIDQSEDGVPTINDQISHIIHNCCRKEPWARYQTVDKLIADINHSLTGDSTPFEKPDSPIVAQKIKTNRKETLDKRPVGFLSLHSRILPVAITILLLALFGLALFNSWIRGGPSIILISQQIPLLVGGENSPAAQTRSAEGATATIQALQIRLPTRTATPSPTMTVETFPENIEELSTASAPSETPTAFSTPTPTQITAPTNPPPPPSSPTPTETPTNPAPTPSPTPTNSPPPPVPTNPPLPSPTNLPNPTNIPEPTDPPPPTPTPPPPPTPTPPVFPTSTPPPTSTPTQT